MDAFPKNLDQWHEEPIEIDTIDPILNKNGDVVGMKTGKRTVTQKVRYSQMSSPRKVACGDMQHEWYIPDPHDHVAHCRNCPKRKFIRSVYERVLQGKILDRDSLLQIA